jgi:F-type H+-transporting ATPase subunit delta
MRDRRVAKRYATALFRLALEIGKVEEIDSEALTLETVFADKALLRFFSQPQISRAKKSDFIEANFRGRIHPFLLNLLLILLNKGRIAFATDVFDYYDLLTDRYRGEEEVHIVTAVAVDEMFVERLIERLRRFSKYTDLRVTKSVDTAVIGGVKVYLGRHTVMDGSIATRLTHMREKLLLYRDY